MQLRHALLGTGLAVILSLLLGLPSNGFAADTQAGVRTPEYTEGVQAYRAQDYAKAARLFSNVLDQDGYNVNARYYRALSLDYLNRKTEAAAEYRQVVAAGTEVKIVDFARKRLNALQADAPALAAAGTASSPGNGMALMAAGTEIAPAVYRGNAARVAVPLKNSRNALMVDALLTSNKRQSDGTFIVDTGATYTSISREMAEELGLDLTACETVRITTANGRIEVPKVVIDTLSVNGLEAHNVEATVIPMKHGGSFSGLIGLSFIRQFVLTIDPQGGQLIFQKN